MATKALPMIARKYIKPRGLVDVWDMQIDRGTDALAGPLRLEMTAILAREALQRDSDRYKLELPRGEKPGPAQIEAELRAAEELADPDEKPDPVYGKRSQQ